MSGAMSGAVRSARADMRRVVELKVQMRGSRKKRDQAQNEPEGKTAEKK